MEYLSQAALLNLPATALAALAMLVAHWLPTSSLLFGRAYIRLSGVRPGDIRPADARRTGIVAIITALIASLLMGLVAAHAGGNSTMLFAGAGFIWLFVMLEQLRLSSWQRHPFALFLLLAIRSLAGLMAAATVFYLWS